MTFLSPSFLWAFAAVAVPVVIHLFNFRIYRRVYFSNVRFLREALEETKSASRLREILVLIARCLAIACLVLAFARPVIPDDPTAVTGANAVSIYIDNSFSMQNVSRQGPLIDMARERAREIIRSYTGSDKFQVITNDFEGRHQRLVSAEDAFALVDDIRVSPAVRPVSAVLQRQQEFLKTAAEKNRAAFLLSDLQRSTFDLPVARPDTAMRCTVVPLVANRVNNAFVDTCWFDSPVRQKGVAQKLHARIVNSGNEKINAGSARLAINGKQLALASFSVEADNEVEVQFSFVYDSDEFAYGSVKIEDYPVSFDDELYFAFNPSRRIHVCVISGKEADDRYFRSLFMRDSLFVCQFYNERNIDFSALKRSAIVILNQVADAGTGAVSEIAQFSRNGGSVVLIPPAAADITPFNQIVTALNLPALGAADTAVLRMAPIETATGFFAGVFEKRDERMNVPTVRKHHRIPNTSRSRTETLLSLQNGDELLLMQEENASKVYLFTTPFDGVSTNLARHALFVPLFYRIAFGSLHALPLSYNVAENVLIESGLPVASAESPAHLVRRDGGMDVIPERRVVNGRQVLYTRGQVSLPGYYSLVTGGRAEAPLAFNYSRKESRLESWSPEDLRATIREKGWRRMSVAGDGTGGGDEAFLRAGGGRKLSELFIILALVFLAAEALLLRLLK